MIRSLYWWHPIYTKLNRTYRKIYIFFKKKKIFFFCAFVSNSWIKQGVSMHRCFANILKFIWKRLDHCCLPPWLKSSIGSLCPPFKKGRVVLGPPPPPPPLSSLLSSFARRRKSELRLQQLSEHGDTERKVLGMDLVKKLGVGLFSPFMSPFMTLRDGWRSCTPSGGGL